MQTKHTTTSAGHPMLARLNQAAPRSVFRLHTPNVTCARAPEAGARMPAIERQPDLTRRMRESPVT